MNEKFVLKIIFDIGLLKLIHTVIYAYCANENIVIFFCLLCTKLVLHQQCVQNDNNSIFCAFSALLNGNRHTKMNVSE